MLVAILNDTHAGIRNSSDIFMEYQERFYSEVFFPHLIENGITRILHLGDYYDNRKTVNFKTVHRNRKMFLEKLREHGMTMDIIPGNHDVYFKNTNELNALKELQGHYIDVVNIVLEPGVVDYDGMAVALIPWINDENRESTLEFLETCEAKVVGAHLELEGFEMQKGMECVNGMSSAPFEKFDMVLTGHFHTKSTRGNIHYLGAQMEFFWNDCGDPKYFHVMDTSDCKLTPVRNPLTIYEKIYYNASGGGNRFMDLSHLDGKFVKVVVVDKGNPIEFEKFIDRIQSRNIHELKIADDFREFMGKNVEDGGMNLEDTETIIYDYIDNVDTDLDKGRIKNELSVLMTEAQNMEVL